MSYALQRAALGRQPMVAFEMDLDFCANTYGVAPCTASGSAGSECYNTRKTCQDVANYSKTTKTYRFCQPMEGLPVTVDMYPALEPNIDLAPMLLTPGKGLGYRAVITLKVRDFPHHDRGVDPYVGTRGYTPESQGTFWGKLLARNPYYRGRPARIRAGYLTDPWDWANFETRAYIIDEMKGPDKTGMVIITLKDPLVLADDDKAKCPAASNGVLAADITSGATSLTLSPSGVGNSEYPTSGTLRIGSEEMTFSSRSGDTISGLTRGVNGSTADSHTTGDTVQLCKVYTAANIIDVIDDLLNNYVDNFDAANWIPYDQGISGPATGTNDEWDDEKALYLSSANVTRTISKPTGVNQLISELTEEFAVNIFWHETDQEVKVRAIAPPKANAAVTAYDDDSSILRDTMQVVVDEKQRVSQVWIYYGIIDNTGDAKPENYRFLYIATDLNQEDANLYGAKQVKVIYAKWIYAEGQAAQLGGRILARFYEGPRIVTFQVDAKDGDKVPGDLFDLTTRFIQDSTGAKKTSRFEVMRVAEKKQGHAFEYMALVSSFNGLYGFIGPNTLGDYSAESDINKRQYGFICPDTGLFADGSAGYKII